MRMKTFEAETMQETLLKVKEELGPEAVILKTKKVAKRGLGKNKHVFEVTAALDDKLYAKPDSNQITSKDAGTYSRETLTGRQVVKAPVNDKVSDLDGQLSNSLKDLIQKLNEPDDKFLNVQNGMRELMVQVSQIKHSLNQFDLDSIPETVTRHFEFLLDLGFDSDLARELVNRLKLVVPEAKLNNLDLCKKSLKKMISNRLSMADKIVEKPGRPAVHLFVGSTGAGKTTVIARMAGYYKYECGKKVGILTTDSYRFGAIEQMDVFCRAADIPFQVAFSAEEIDVALKALNDCEIIFVDTSGRNQNHPSYLSQMNGLVGNLQPDAVHVVLSCMTGTKDLMALCEGYRKLPIHDAIFTKADESRCLGNIYNICALTKIPLAFVSRGQNIAEPIPNQSKSEIAELIFEESR